jgi:hypothetical protein
VKKGRKVATDKRVGRPPMYSDPEEMQKAIDAYFSLCEGEKALDDEGNPITTKYGYLYKVEPKPPTITGLALALGFNSRQALLNYQGREAFNDTVTRAKARVEEYAESRLFDKDGANGAKFSLANNFRGWAEKQEIDMTAGMTIKVELTDD